MSGAPLDKAFDTLSPYQGIQLLQWTPEKLLALGYQPFSPTTTQDAKICQNLVTTVEALNEFFWIRFRRVGIDNQGRIPPFFIGIPDKNAYYQAPESGLECFKFNRRYLLQYPEVIAHEYTHGVIKYLRPLGNRGEAGALNEAIADVVAIVFKRHWRKVKDWRVGDQRDLSILFRASDLKPADELQDRGNVHHNSCLFSHAFYLVSKVTEKYDDGDQLLLDIWLTAVKRLDTLTFKSFVQQTILVGFELGGKPFSDQIKSAWKVVGNPSDQKEDPRDRKDGSAVSKTPAATKTETPPRKIFSETPTPPTASQTETPLPKKKHG